MVVTQDSQTRSVNVGVKKIKKKRAKRNFHARCHHPTDSEFIEETCDDTEEECDDKDEDDIVRYAVAVCRVKVIVFCFI